MCASGPACRAWSTRTWQPWSPMTRDGSRRVPSPVLAPLTLEISELFQIDKGKIDQVEAVINTVPYGMRSAVWD